MSNFVLAQLIGVVAVCLSILIFQVNNRQHMLKFSVAACSLYALQYYLLGAYTGLAMNLLGGTKSYVFLKVKPSRKYNKVLLAFVGISMVATVATWQGPISLLAMSGNIFNTFAMWHINPKYIRRWSLVAPPFWFMYNFVSGSYPGMFIDTVILISNLVGEYRYDHKHIKHIQRRLAKPA